MSINGLIYEYFCWSCVRRTTFRFSWVHQVGRSIVLHRLMDHETLMLFIWWYREPPLVVGWLGASLIILWCQSCFTNLIARNSKGAWLWIEVEAKLLQHKMRMSPAISMFALYHAFDWSRSLWISAVWFRIRRYVYYRQDYILKWILFQGWHINPQNRNYIRGKIPANFISSGDGPVKGSETRQRWKYARRLPYYGTMAEKAKKTALQLLYVQQM